MDHSFDIRVSPRDADAALRRLFLREAGWGGLIAMILCLGYVVYDFLDGPMNFVGTAILTLVLVMIVFYLAAFVIRKRQMGELLRRIGDHPISYHFGELEIETKSVLGSSSLKWEVIQKLWIEADVTMVLFARGGYLTIPTEQIPPAALDFLVAQVRRAGGRITGGAAPSSP